MLLPTSHHYHTLLVASFDILTYHCDMKWGKDREKKYQWKRGNDLARLLRSFITLTFVCRRVSHNLPPACPDLEKFHHFCKYLKMFGNTFKVYLDLGRVFNSLLHNLYAFWGQILIAVNGQILKIQSGHTAIQPPLQPSSTFFSFLKKINWMWQMLTQSNRTCKGLDDQRFIFHAQR